jgi:hypothetical protein
MTWTFVTVTYNSAETLKRYWSDGLPDGVEWIVVDNYSAMWSSAIRRITAEHSNVRAHLFSVATCPSSLDLSPMDAGVVSRDLKGTCAKMHELVTSYIKANRPQLVIFANSIIGVTPAKQDQYLNGVKRFIGPLKKYANRLAILGSVPHYADPKIASITN